MSINNPFNLDPSQRLEKLVPIKPILTTEKPETKKLAGSIFTEKKTDVAGNPSQNIEKIGEEANKMNDFNGSYPGVEFSGNQPVEKTVATTPAIQAVPKDKINPQASKPEAVATPKEEKEDSVNEEGSLGDLQDKKQEIVDSKKGDATKVLAEKSDRFQRLDGKSKAIDDRLTELKKKENPTEEDKKAIEKLEAKKGRIDSRKSAMVENVAEKIASKDKGYQELSKAEAKEQKIVDQYALYDITGEDGEKLTPEQISNLHKQEGNKLFDKDGKALSKEQLKKNGFKKTLSDEAIAMMMNGGNPNMISGKGAWAGGVTQMIAALTQMNEYGKAQKQFANNSQGEFIT